MGDDSYVANIPYKRGIMVSLATEYSPGCPRRKGTVASNRMDTASPDRGSAKKSEDNHVCP